jgi:hypothetical protein
MINLGLGLLLSAVLLACGSPNTGHTSGGAEPAAVPTPVSQTATPPALAPRPDLHCTPQAEGDEAACRQKQGKDCRFEPASQCRGVPPTEGEQERMQRAYEAGTLPCACQCEVDRICNRP